MSLASELCSLGKAITRLREDRTSGDKEGLGIDVRRVGIAATIFHLRCVAAQAVPTEEKDIALEGLVCQFDTVNQAVARLLTKDDKDTVGPVISEVRDCAHAVMIAARQTIEER